MKLIKAIIQPEKLEDIKESLKEIGVTKMTFYNASGCGAQGGYTQEYRGVKKEVNWVAKIMIEIGVTNDLEKSVIEAIYKAAYTGNVGDGKIFVLDLKEVVRIRTNERGKKAI